MDETSEEEEEEEEDDELEFNNRIKNGKKSKKSEDEKLSENSSSVIGSDKSSTINSKSKLAKLVKKGNRSRLIRSMQNLLSYDRSRSNSNDRETSNLNEHKSHKKSKTDLNETSKSGRKKLNEENDSPKESSKSEIFKSIFAKNKWDKKNNQVYEIESSDTPSLINVRKIDSVKRYNTNKIDDTITVDSSSKTVSRKPPIDKRAYKIQCQKPVIQGFLNKRKPQTSSSTSNLSGLANSSNSSILSGSSGSYSNTNSLLRNHMSRGKWKHYWCVLVKDYMTFYKQPDDKIPKDFLLLKDFNIFSTNHKNGFILFDKIKQVEHEFYANTFEEYQSWYQALIDLRNRLKSESTNSLNNNTLSSSGYDSISSNQTNGSPIIKSSDDSVNSPLTQSLPSSSTLNRKNNLKLNLSTIMDSNDDPQNQNTSPTLMNVNTSPTLISNYQQIQQNHSYASSRESSPAISNKASRDSSPSMIYQEQDLGFTTSESDAEFYSKATAGEAVKEVNFLAIFLNF